MRRTGSHILGIALVLLVPLGAVAGPELSQAADRLEMGQEDTLTLTVVATDPPEGAMIQFPSSPDFEVLSRFQSSQRSFQLGGPQAGVHQIDKYTFVMRPLRKGKLTIPPAQLKGARGGAIQSQSVSVVVKPGSLTPGHRPSHSAPTSRNGMPSIPGFDDDDPLDELLGMTEERIPHSDSDLFLKAYLDKSSVFLGEQVTYSLYIFSRVDLSTVDTATLPKMDGFWAEDVDSGQLSGEPRVLDGVPYRAYLIKRRALFPEKTGTMEIPAASAEMTTGFLFSGRRLHRDSNTLKLEVKPTPPGAPPDFRPEQVGEWALATEVQPREVELGQPVTVKVALEGKGNLKRMSLPKLPAVSGLKTYDPTTTDSLSTRGGRVSGRRVQEYLVMPQRTGAFQIPALRFSYFNPRNGRYQSADSVAVSVTVKAGPNAPPESTNGGPTVAAAGAKNVLSGGTLRPPRSEAELRNPTSLPWKRPLFFGLAAIPACAYLAAALATRARTPRPEDAAALQRRKARAARERLSRARSLMDGPGDAFHAEVERAVLSALELKVGAPVGGLARTELVARLAEAGLPERARNQVLAVLEACESARYAPGLIGAAGEGERRQRLLDQAGAIIAGGAA